MKVLLLNPPSKILYLRDYYCGGSSKADYYWPPLDLLVLSGIFKEKHEVYVLDANVEGLSFKEAEKKVLEIKPDVIVFLATTPSMKNDMKFVKAVKDKIKCKIYGSGHYFYFETMKAMKEYPYLDGILLDFTHDSIVKLIEGEKSQLYDLVYRDGRKIVKAPKSSFKSFSYPVPLHQKFPIEKYRIPHAEKYPFTSCLTNFGCPFNCAFCCAACMSYKERDIENLIDELNHVKSLGIKEILFRDLTFTVNKKYVMDICKRMIDEKLGLSWICLTRANLVDEELLKLMKEAGCHSIQFGFESGSERILKMHSKHVDKQKMIETTKICRKLGISTLGHFIIGLPGETKDDVEMTIKFALDLDCDYSAFNLFQPYLGSKLRNDLLKSGLLADREVDFIDSSRTEYVYETKELKKDDLLKFRRKALRKFYLRPRYIFRLLKRVTSFRQMRELFKNGMAVLREMFG